MAGLRTALLTLALPLAPCASVPAAAPAAVDVAALEAGARATEAAFARTMAERDLDAFAGFIAEDAIFSPGPNTLRGKAAIVAAWSKYFEGEQAPFSWRPETVVVNASGDLAATKGPVFDPSGKPIAEFRSTWRREADGSWKVVFDDGTCLCRPAG
ncbi:YybH family protein [Arenimonas caeni]|uniref:YybH family protein n=1 Tax=Arenimonas caeni TaxID=2058085 RepID=UPI002A36B5E0|nr:nuclear transport factor 2 family protein [Arenimonas caeni]MDY0021977.1 DUF4440 domain-containing protein [Arenimonas caeni]